VTSTPSDNHSRQRGHTPYAPLPPALDAPLARLDSAACGRIAYYADEDGGDRPLLLIHSINAAPSSFEVKPLFERFRGERPVYSIELPGFGQSERGERAYTPELFASAICELLDQVIGAPADVLALSLSAEFAARAALRMPGSFASLSLISPTGFSKREVPSPRFGRTAYGVLSNGLWAQGLFDLVASKGSIRYFLNRSFGGKAPAELIDYAYATAHQPGARFAPLTFLSMQLFTQDARDVLYTQLSELPVLAIADRDPYVTFERLPSFAAARANWRYESLGPHMGLPHWEHPEATFDLLEGFWRGD
jgi:pimeloyl-ACP methyl ester carboxylesterase